jgi:hypothetical protein
VNRANKENAEKSPEAGDQQLFSQTVRRMLEAPPTPHDEMKMGAARKRDTRSSGKGAKG